MSPLVRALGLEQRVLARRLRCMSQGGRWAIRAAARQGASSSAHAAGFSRSHACTHRKAAEKVILSSCGGSNQHYRENKKAIFFFRFRQSTPSSGSAAAAVSERAPRGTPSRGRRARSLAERKRPASAAAPGCATVPAPASCEQTLSLKGESDFFSTVSTAISCARLRSCAKAALALAAFLQHLPVLEMPDVGHRLLRHALDFALLLACAVGLDREDAVHLGAQAHVLQDPGGKVSSPSLPSWPITSMALARAAAESRCVFQIKSRGIYLPVRSNFG